MKGEGKIKDIILLKGQLVSQFAVLSWMCLFPGKNNACSKFELNFTKDLKPFLWQSAYDPNWFTESITESPLNLVDS